MRKQSGYWNSGSFHHLCNRVFSKSPSSSSPRGKVGGHEGPDGVSALDLYEGSKAVPSYTSLFLMPTWTIRCCARSLALSILQ